MKNKKTRTLLLFHFFTLMLFSCKKDMPETVEIKNADIADIKTWHEKDFRQAPVL